eukprot:UN20525
MVICVEQRRPCFLHHCFLNKWYHPARARHHTGPLFISKVLASWHRVQQGHIRWRHSHLDCHQSPILEQFPH